MFFQIYIILYFYEVFIHKINYCVFVRNFILLYSFVSFVIVILISFPFLLNAQKSDDISAPFLLIAPDARSGGIADAGAATSPDTYSMNWNAAKYAFTSTTLGVGLSYTPYMKELVQDRALIYLTGFYRIGKTETIASSIKYFSFGKNAFISETSEATGEFTPGAWAIDAAYIKKLSPDFSLSTTFRYIYSGIQAIDFHAGNENKSLGVAADLGAFYSRPVNGHLLSFGLQLSNFGPKMNYNGYEQSLPANLRLGFNYTLINASDINFSFISDVSKLMIKVPERDNGFSVSSGGELMLREVLTLRGGYHYEKNSNYFTTGLGVNYKKLMLDVSYLLSAQDYLPFQNTLRFGLAYGFK